MKLGYGSNPPYVAGTANNGLWRSAAARRVTLGLPDMTDSGSPARRTPRPGHRASGAEPCPLQSRALCEELVRAPEPSILENRKQQVIGIGSGGTAKIGLLREGPFERVDEAEFDRHALVGERIAERSERVALRARATPSDPRYDRPLDAVESGQSIAVLRCRRSNSTDCIRHLRRRAPISYSRLRPHQTACSASDGSATAISRRLARGANPNGPP